jgi:cation transport regulator ChaC
MNDLIFAYGSNMDLVQMRERCPNSPLSPVVAEARGWKLCFPRRSDRRKGGVGSVMQDKSASVWGVVFVVTQQDLERLDGFEGIPTGAYKREPINVFDRHGTAMKVWVYKAMPQESGDFKPHRDYIALYVRGATHFDLPPEYVKSLEELRDCAIQD